MPYKPFGVMIDCSRGAVLNVSAVKKLIDTLQKMHYNALELYTEDTFAVDGEPYFGYLRGRYSGDELQEIDAYAAAHGIELIPCVQTLAHFTNPVKLPRFAEITDVNDILLADDEKTYEFLDRVFASLARNFTSRNVNIGMDEAHMVGLGKYLDRHGFGDRFELLCRHLTRVLAIAAKYGFTAHMWSDMFFRLAAKGEYYGQDMQLPPALLGKVPKDIALTFWDYYHTDESHYNAMFDLHKKFGNEVWFAGGAWTWGGFAPKTRFSYASMLPAMRSVRRSGIENVLVTMWGDNGGECPPFALLQVLYAIRRYADGEYDDTKIAAEFQELFGIAASDFDLLELPDIVPDIADVNDHANPSKALLYGDPFLGVFDSAVNRHVPIPYGQYAQMLGEAKKRTGEYAYLFATAQALCHLMEIKAYLGVRTRRAYRDGDKAALAAIAKDYAEAEKKLDAFFDAFAAGWEKCNKSQGFEVHCARLGGVKQRLRYCRRKLTAYAAGTIGGIEELEEELLPLHPASPGNLFSNEYRRLISTSEL